MSWKYWKCVENKLCLWWLLYFFEWGGCAYNLIFNQNCKKITVHVKNVVGLPLQFPNTIYLKKKKNVSMMPTRESNTTWCSNSTFHQIASARSCDFTRCCLPPGGASTILFGRWSALSLHIPFGKLRALYKDFFIHYDNNLRWMDTVILIVLMRKPRLFTNCLR